ncbi:Four helix bundle sensory module for signal transduction [Maribacter orientalis]|uniref:Four helix bundle sensory module for signal transduction n=1 Tax=Maribacter orientalis TaxID=228957 RepID=A0A1H7LFQ4_9FLAO|nr:MCP four helix bundle domain-containing protein [Maribacter orientalis]SEK97733.1 Four helix bundle sensory module for signal transduction [Maribacter orientalis]|tara:strand:+ start:45 stop:686 length:642 start_codon:yes stop_codon:yes gene_type:complete
MFTKLTIPQRIQIGLVLVVAFLLVLGTNRLDQRHFSTIQTTVNSVYKDRVVVQNFIYQLTTIFHGKELRIISNENNAPIATENQKVQKLLVDFEATQLTPKEFNLLNKLKNQFSKLQEIENRITETSGNELSTYTVAAGKKLEEMRSSLDGLANIQLEESELMTQLSNKSLGMNILLSKLEVAFMVVIGITMLVLIFNPMKLLHAHPNEPSPN